jgi:hypothetical protein
VKNRGADEVEGTRAWAASATCVVRQEGRSMMAAVDDSLVFACQTRMDSHSLLPPAMVTCSKWSRASLVRGTGARRFSVGRRVGSSLDRFELESLPPRHAQYGSKTRSCNTQRNGGQTPKCAPDRASATRRCRPYTTREQAADAPRPLTRRVKGTCSRAYGAPYSMSDTSSHQA